MSKPHAQLELRAWALMAVPTGVLTGGVIGVLINGAFAGAAAAWLLGGAVALVTGAGPIANVTSALWSHWSQGRDRVGALLRLQAAFAACLLVAAAAPLSSAGLVLIVAATLAARATWCGTLTIRALVWHANFTRAARTAFAAHTQIVVAIIMATVGAVAGFTFDLGVANFRWLLAACAVFALLSLLPLRRLKIRRQRQRLSAERARTSTQRFSPDVYLAILRDDRLYRAYLSCLMVQGTGTMMLTAPLIFVLTDALAADRFTQVLISSALPMLLMPITTPLWARLLTRRHVIAFRAVNSLVFVAATGTALLGAVLGQLALLWVAAVLLGIAQGGSVLSWTLGHSDFAGDAQVADYVGLHVTLTGIRGLIAPLAGVAVYFGLEHYAPGAGVWALALPLLLTSAGAAGFARLSRDPRLEVATEP